MENSKESPEVDISIVVPLYNEEESLAELTTAIEDSISATYSYEVIFVDDGSTDTSFQV
ncbi:MAG TPA: glycosyltransferase, partial [Balneola sp.]|nr:glycosyltransferase [Balneola sp.]